MVKAIDEIKDRDIEAPWHVYRYLGNGVFISGEQASLSNDGDFGKVSELRAAIEWYVDQFGGTVKWSKDND